MSKETVHNEEECQQRGVINNFWNFIWGRGDEFQLLSGHHRLPLHGNETCPLGTEGE